MLSLVMKSDPIVQLRRSQFRRRFSLNNLEKKQLRIKSLTIVEEEIYSMIGSKLANPKYDGRQTPYYGNPIFKAMHATACCCRKCLFKWHRIPYWKELEKQEIKYISSLIMRWIKKEMIS